MIDLLSPENRWMWCVLYGHNSSADADGKCPRCGQDVAS